MGVVLATTDEPLYLPRSIDPVLAAHADDIDAVIVVPPGNSRLREARRYTRMLGAWGLLALGVPFALARLATALPTRLERRLTGRLHSVHDIAATHGVPSRTVPDADDPAFERWLRSQDPRVLLSVVCGQRLPPAVLEVPEHAINVHGSLLPRYRGRATAFWPLHNGDDEAGVTAHEMTARFDAGPILERRRFPLHETDSLHDVRVRIARTAGSLAVDLLDGDLDAVEARPNPSTEDDYHTLPTAADRREFLSRGNRFR